MKQSQRSFSRIPKVSITSTTCPNIVLMVIVKKSMSWLKTSKKSEKWCILKKYWLIKKMSNLPWLKIWWIISWPKIPWRRSWHAIRLGETLPKPKKVQLPLKSRRLSHKVTLDPMKSTHSRTPLVSVLMRQKICNGRLTKSWKMHLKNHKDSWTHGLTHIWRM